MLCHSTCLLPCLAQKQVCMHSSSCVILADIEGVRRHKRPESTPGQHKLVSPHWQRKSPSQIQQHLEDKHAAAAQRRSLQQVQTKARQARAQAGRQVPPKSNAASGLLLRSKLQKTSIKLLSPESVAIPYANMFLIQACMCCQAWQPPMPPDHTFSSGRNCSLAHSSLFK